jgi:hypothetical protein
MRIMYGFFKRKGGAASALSDFVRNASSSDKKRIYTRVLERATERQRSVMEKAARNPSK